MPQNDILEKLSRSQLLNLYRIYLRKYVSQDGSAQQAALLHVSITFVTQTPKMMKATLR